MSCIVYYLDHKESALFSGGKSGDSLRLFIAIDDVAQDREGKPRMRREFANERAALCGCVSAFVTLGIEACVLVCFVCTVSSVVSW